MAHGRRPGRLYRRVVRVGQLSRALPAAQRLRDPAGANDGTATFRGDATFQRVPGLADSTWSSFRSYNFPDRYLRHTNYVLRIDPLSSSSSASDRQDATFRVS